MNITPHGLMVAPYPISGAVRMIDTDFDQLITRDDHLDVYLNLQGRGDEAKLRMRASDFLDGKAQEYDSFVRLMNMYPEVQSVVFYRKIFYRQEYAETAKQLAAGEVIDLTSDIKPNYDFFKSGPGYGAKDQDNGL